MKYFAIFLMSSTMISCTKEDSTLYYASLENTTTHKVEVRPYFAGSIVQSKIVVLPPGSKKEIANGFERGISKGGFISSYFAGSDSLIVVFDDIYSISHYGATPQSLASKYYLFSNGRNISNWRSYELSQRDLSKHQRENVHLFKFIEQDYLDSK
jgi:hypothetical protein